MMPILQRPNTQIEAVPLKQLTEPTEETDIQKLDVLELKAQEVNIEPLLIDLPLTLEDTQEGAGERSRPTLGQEHKQPARLLVQLPEQANIDPANRDMAKGQNRMFLPMVHGVLLTWIIRSVVIAGFAGIAAVIFWPTAMNCGSRARKIEGRQYLQEMNRAQQAYHVEHQTFSRNLKGLKSGLSEQSSSYRYISRGNSRFAYQYSISRRNDFHSSVGLVVFTNPAPAGQALFLSVACEAHQPGTLIPPLPVLQNGVPTCAPGTQMINQR